MKRYLWILLFALLLVGCLPVIYVEFDNADLADTECWIHVDSDNNQPIFHTSPGGAVVSVIEALDLPPNLNDQDDYIIVDARFTVSRFAVSGEGYWFEVNVSGVRHYEGLIVDAAYFAQGEDSPFGFPIIPGESIYEEGGNIATGTYWIPESQVTNTVDLESINCVNESEDDESEPARLPQVYYCSVSQPPSDNFEVAFRMGPGTRRSVRFVAVEPFEYDVHGYALFLDTRWLQVDSGDYGMVWVNENDVTTDDHCTILPEVPVPPTITRPVQPEEGSCADFYIISPRGQVAEENSIYSWTRVDEADEYVLTFFNYLSGVSDVIPVDGSQTSVEIVTGSLHTGSSLNFDVTAKKDGEVLCTTDLSGWIERLAARTIEEPEPSETPEKEKKDKKNGGYTPPDEEDYVPPGE